MFGIGMQELLIILLVALVVIGPTKLPEVARSLAKGLRELRRASDDLRSTIMVDLDEPPPRAQPSAPRALGPRSEAKDADVGSDDAVAKEVAPDDGRDDVTPAIHGSVAVLAAEGTVSRGESIKSAGPDPDDADDHAGMPFAPGSKEIDLLLANAKQKKSSTAGSADTAPALSDDGARDS